MSASLHGWQAEHNSDDRPLELAMVGKAVGRGWCVRHDGNSQSQHECTTLWKGHEAHGAGICEQQASDAFTR